MCWQIRDVSNDVFEAWTAASYILSLQYGHFLGHVKVWSAFARTVHHRVDNRHMSHTTHSLISITNARLLQIVEWLRITCHHWDILRRWVSLFQQVCLLDSVQIVFHHSFKLVSPIFEVQHGEIYVSCTPRPMRTDRILTTTLSCFRFYRSYPELAESAERWFCFRGSQRSALISFALFSLHCSTDLCSSWNSSSYDLHTTFNPTKSFWYTQFAAVLSLRLMAYLSNKLLWVYGSN